MPEYLPGLTEGVEDRTANERPMTFEARKGRGGVTRRVGVQEA